MEDGDSEGDRLMDIYERLEEMDAVTAESKAAKLLHGLGFSKRVYICQLPTTWPPYPMYYQLTPHKSTTIGFSVIFECLLSFLHAFLNAETCFDALQPSQSG